MTAKDYLISQLKDPYSTATSVQTRTALSAYAICINKGVDGYSISEAETLISSFGFDTSFVKRCIDFLSYSDAFLTMSKRIPSNVEYN